MSRINDIDLKKWRESDVLTDSLWIFNERDNSGKHNGFYHGNFVPQIPHQLIKKYTKRNDVVLDLFLGSGTTAFEAEKLERNFIGIDIQPSMVNYVKTKLGRHENYFYDVVTGDSAEKKTSEIINQILNRHKRKKVQLAILHPPYANIIKFSEYKNDLSNARSLKEFLSLFSKAIDVTNEILENNRYLAIVIGDIYKQGEWVPLGFYCMHEAQKHGLKVKSIVVKNMTNNRGKKNQESIWRYRSLANDYYVFKHEYIIILKKT